MGAAVVVVVGAAVVVVAGHSPSHGVTFGLAHAAEQETPLYASLPIQ